jgi:hypothetical protein
LDPFLVEQSFLQDLQKIFSENFASLVKEIRRKRESPIPVLQTQSAFHQHAQRNVFRRRDVRQQRRCSPVAVHF